MPDAAAPPPRYRFSAFELSPARRQLHKDDVDLRLIPRYFDLLLLLVTERHRAVHRQEIFDRVWSDVIVSDGALSQAVRTLRRLLDDDPREPQFIRTVSRHGYQFVWPDVVEEPDGLPTMPPAGGVLPRAVGGNPPAAATVGDTTDPPVASEPGDPYAPLLDRLLRRGSFAQATDEERRDAAEQLHALGTATALARLDREPGHAEARALLRDARWDVPGAGEVPLVGVDGWPASVLALVSVRLRRAARLISSRWAFASAGGALAGTLAGMVGAVALLLATGAAHGWSIVFTLALVGLVAGAIGAAGVGAGLAAAEALARSQRAFALVVCGAAGGAAIGWAARHAARAVLRTMFGHDVTGIGGGIEGLLIGAAAGMGYALATPRLAGGGLATPRGPARLRVAITTGVACALGGLVLATAGRHLVAASLDVIADAFDGSAVGLAPLARLLGEQSLRPVTRTLVSIFEGLLFGMGLAYGLTHRPAGRD